MADWNSGRDAAYIKPKFIPDAQLVARDDSGGYDFDMNHTAQFDDGGKVTGGAKSWLSASGGGDADQSDMGGEVSNKPRLAEARRDARK